MSKKLIGVPLEGFAKLCREAAAQGAVLLKNEVHTLPVTDGECVSVFGRIQKDYYRSGTGSGGAVNVPYATNLLDRLRQCDNLKINEELAGIYEQWIQENPFNDGGVHLLEGTDPEYGSLAGQGNHSLSTADVDGDGCMEIIYGAAVIAHDGSLLYSSSDIRPDGLRIKLGHGDAMHVAKIDPDRPGLLRYAAVWAWSCPQ